MQRFVEFDHATVITNKVLDSHHLRNVLNPEIEFTLNQAKISQCRREQIITNGKIIRIGTFIGNTAHGAHQPKFGQFSQTG
jgi:hypothetical protein